MSDRVAEIIESFRAPIPLDDWAFSGPMDSSESLPPEPFRDAQSAKLAPFEIYVVGYTDADQETAKVQVATGTVIDSEDDITAVTITGMDTVYEMTDGDWAWLDVSFDSAGVITAIAFNCGGTWAGFPQLYSTGKWYHPIAQARASKTAKSTTAGAPNAPFPDQGEFPEIETSIKIAQKTNTHLMKARICAGPTKALAWALVPGPGGDDA